MKMRLTYRIFTLLLVLAVLLVITISVNNAFAIQQQSNYVQTTGTLGAQSGVSTNTEVLLAGHTYYYVIKTTEPIKLSSTFLNVWNFTNGCSGTDRNETVVKGVLAYCWAHLDFDVYEAIGTQDASTRNPFILKYTYRLPISNTTTVSTCCLFPIIRPYTTSGNVYVALAVTPSIDLEVNKTKSSDDYTLFEASYRRNSISAIMLSQRQPFYFNTVWNLEKGANSTVVTPPSPYTLSPEQWIEDFAVSLNLPVDMLGITIFAIVSFIVLLVMIIFGVKSVTGVGLVMAVLGVFFYRPMYFIPIWFLVVVEILAVILILGGASKASGGEVGA